MAITTVYTTIMGEIVEEVRNGTVHHLVPDTLGSVTMILDDTGTVTDTREYWPYGETRASTGNTSTPLEFVGTLGYVADSPERTYVRARMLRRDVATWATVDPVWPSEPAYCYVHDPVKSVDPAGLMAMVLPMPPNAIPLPILGGALAALLALIAEFLGIILIALLILLLLIGLVLLRKWICKQLEKKYHQVCPYSNKISGIRKCSWTDSCPTLFYFSIEWEKCAKLREMTAFFCFGGFDYKHWQAYLEARRYASECQFIFLVRCKCFSFLER